MIPVTSHEGLVNQLIAEGTLKGEALIRAFRAVDRKDFVPEHYEMDAYEDIPIPVGYGQTTSQPSTIAFMLDKLDIAPGNNVLEVGTGYGYATALLDHLVGPQGRVVSVEYLKELAIEAEINLRTDRVPPNIYLVVGDGKLGAPDEAPFDRVIAWAEVREVPLAWKDQLKVGGVIITPFDGKVLKLVKTSPDQVNETYFPAFAFVKLE